MNFFFDCNYSIIATDNGKNQQTDAEEINRTKGAFHPMHEVYHPAHDPLAAYCNFFSQSTLPHYGLACSDKKQILHR